jgi:hypothetical protein
VSICTALRIRQFIEPADLFHGLNRGASARLIAQEVLNKQAGEILTVTKSQDSPKRTVMTITRMAPAWRLKAAVC